MRIPAFPLLLALASSAAFAQSGLIQGVVTDPADAVVPEVKVAAWDDARGILVREAVTGQDGTSRDSTAASAPATSPATRTHSWTT